MRKTIFASDLLRLPTRRTVLNLAELDFKIRGPGDLFGAKQSGLPPLRIADLVRDQSVLIETRTAAQELFATKTRA